LARVNQRILILADMKRAFLHKVNLSPATTLIRGDRMYDAKTNPRGRRPAAFFLAILLALSLSLGVGVSMTERAVRKERSR